MTKSKRASTNQRHHRDTFTKTGACCSTPSHGPQNGSISADYPITSQAYQKLLSQRLEDIAQHGDPKRYHNYFPRYLLKTIQDWFAHHGDTLYEELKHVRNQLCEIDALLQQNTRESTEDIVTPLAEAHAVLAAQNHRKKRADLRQLNLL